MRLQDNSIPATVRLPNAATGRLLDWYDVHHRRLPWRITPDQSKAGQVADPYRIWLSEIMLQQTTVQAVKSYFEKFVTLWPDIAALAAVDNEEVMKAWAGLGYYSRARNLKKCAEQIVEEHQGVFPDTAEGLMRLPGIGPYTAGAIAAIAFDRPETAIDGNVERVITRLFAIARPVREVKAEIRNTVQSLVPASRPGDFAQAMMDLGATICTPKRPACALCPMQQFCIASDQFNPESFPVKPPRQNKPERKGAVFVAVRDNGSILLQKRPENGLLGGMSEAPTTDWSARVDGATTADAAPFAARWQRRGTISHVFTHFRLELTVYLANVGPVRTSENQWWCAGKDISGEALPTLMKKAIECALPGSTKANNGRSHG